MKSDQSKRIKANTNKQQTITLSSIERGFFPLVGPNAKPEISGDTYLPNGKLVNVFYRKSNKIPTCKCGG